MPATVSADLPRLESSTEPPCSPSTRERIRSLDIVRGAVMVLMALDHVRWFLSSAKGDPTDLGSTTIALFMTRWVTHLCAPAFVFLAGTGAFLYGARVGSRAALARFLVTRGVWLIVIELTVVRLGWTFNFNYAHYVFGGVIWMIGWCMILLAALVRLPPAIVGMLGVMIIASHNLIDAKLPTWLPEIAKSDWRWLWQVAYLSGVIKLGAGGPRLAVLFVIVPWIGVMAAGYGFGAIMQMPPARRTRTCLALGIVATAAFVVLRATNACGDPRPWTTQPRFGFSVLAFLNTQKYPASLLFLLMTLGPTIALVPVLETMRGRIVDMLAIFGRVPFLFYVLHLPLIHAVAVLLSLAQQGQVIPWLTANHPMMAGQAPDGHGYGLAVVYLVTAAVVALLYLPCRWLARVKQRRHEWWLSLL